VTTQQQQADSAIHEDQLLNFLVNTLTGAFGISIAGNGDIDPEDIYEVLVGATADGTSISTLCERGQDSYSGNDILYHLRTKFDLDTVSSVGNTLLRQYTLEMLPEQVEIVVDFHLRPYYGDEDETEDLYYSEAKRGTTAFHAYATLYARVKNKRYTLAVRRVTHGDTASEVLAAGSSPLQQTLRNRSNVPSLGVIADLDDNERFDEAAPVRRDQPAHAERVAVSALGVRGDAAPRRASPLVVAVQGIHSDGHSCSMERVVGETRDSSDQAT
jgi:hypothetical protein